MGCEFKATCSDCGCEFTANYGGGFDFYLIRCNTCGAEDFIPLDGPKPSRWRRLLGRIGLGKKQKRCRCGGVLSEDAPIRCLACRSTKIEIGETVLNYD